MHALLKPGVALLVTGALAVFGLVAAGVALGETGEQGPEPSRAGMRSEVAGVTPPPCPAEACMALTVKNGGTCADGACTVSTGDKFTLAVEIEVAPADGYILAQTWIDFGIQLTYNPAVARADEIVWPDCLAFTAVRSETDTSVAHGCLSGLVPPLSPSTYIGNFVELSFTCSSGPSSTELRLVPLGESPADTSGTAFAVRVSDPAAPTNPIVPSVRDLTVQCTAPTATATGTLPATPASSATPTPAGVTTATPPGTPVETPIATLTGGTTATPTFTTTATPAATPTAPATTSEPSPTPTLAATLVGDANCDVNVDPIDAAFILQWSARLLAVLPCPANADASGNGIVNPLDAALILQFSSRLIGTLPP
ncbi:MAG: dockerin type I repeat-containing protein [Chloroflexi bacterium]|nr:dockerin type I repeat-containing protein [Chloroflexota bacterium]